MALGLTIDVSEFKWNKWTTPGHTSARKKSERLAQLRVVSSENWSFTREQYSNPFQTLASRSRRGQKPLRKTSKGLMRFSHARHMHSVLGIRKNCFVLARGRRYRSRGIKNVYKTSCLRRHFTIVPRISSISGETHRFTRSEVALLLLRNLKRK